MALPRIRAWMSWVPGGGAQRKWKITTPSVSYSYGRPTTGTSLWTQRQNQRVFPTGAHLRTCWRTPGWGGVGWRDTRLRRRCPPACPWPAWPRPGPSHNCSSSEWRSSLDTLWSEKYDFCSDVKLRATILVPTLIFVFKQWKKKKKKIVSVPIFPELARKAHFGANINIPTLSLNLKVYILLSFFLSCHTIPSVCVDTLFAEQRVIGQFPDHL